MAAQGPFASFYHSIAGTSWANWLFMLGLLGIGVGLMLGLAMRFTRQHPSPEPTSRPRGRWSGVPSILRVR
jgi:hypothetical protein